MNSDNNTIHNFLKCITAAKGIRIFLKILTVVSKSPLFSSHRTSQVLLHYYCLIFDVEVKFSLFSECVMKEHKEKVERKRGGSLK